jgi:metal-responsive CopG/Arc/MetJ family transcriptional regulator
MSDDSEITIRLPTELLDAVDSWAADHEAARSEAIVALLEHGLAAAKAGK